MISFLTSSSKQVGRDLHRWFFLNNLSLASRVTEPNVQLRNCVEQASLNHYFDDVNPRFSLGFLKGFSPRPFLPPLATPQVVIDDVVMYFLVCPSPHTYISWKSTDSPLDYNYDLWYWLYWFSMIFYDIDRQAQSINEWQAQHLKNLRQVTWQAQYINEWQAQYLGAATYFGHMFHQNVL